MQIHAQGLESQQTFSGVADGLDEDTINGYFNSFDLSDEELRKWIGGLSFSADAKAMLYNISATTIRAGEFVIKIGRKILEAIFFLVRKFPTMTLGLIVGAVLGFLVASIPVIAFVLGSMAIGAVWGAYQDVQGELRREIQELLSGFEALRTV